MPCSATRDRTYDYTNSIQVNSSLHRTGRNGFSCCHTPKLLKSRVAYSLVKAVKIDRAFRFYTCVCHYRYCSFRMFSIGCLSRKHNTVGSIKNGVSHIGTLSAGRTWIFDHRLKHLCCGDDRFAKNVSLAYHHFLGQKDFLRWNFHTKISTSNHDSICYSEDVIIVFKSFLIFDLTDNLHMCTLFTQDLTNFCNIRRLTDEGSSDEINVIRDSPLNNILDVFFC
mmetsp:Transcript_35591/g.82694  ORF Transcript_35591/g.82694 Transcript_35591/m.82694 type:complete len:224 (+) Transcript_35591:569-1240(+)